MSRWRRFLCALTALGATLFAAPAHVMMAGAPPDSPSARVDANTAVSPWSGVGSVVVGMQSYSGVLIAPRFVLTAAHVVGTSAPTSIQFVLNIGTNQSHVLQALRVIRYPTASFPYDDLALIELETPAPSNARIYPLVRTAVAPGQRLTLVGYGGSGNGNVGVSIGGSRVVKRSGENSLDLIQTTLDSSGRTSLFFLYDFDGPSGVGLMGGPTLGNAVETLVAGSDSGSPAFIGGAGAPRLVGINTFVGPSAPGQPNDFRFGSMGGGVLLTHPAFLNWIDSTTGLTDDPISADVPVLPVWALLLGIGAFGAVARRLSDRGSRREQ